MLSEKSVPDKSLLQRIGKSFSDLIIDVLHSLMKYWVVSQRKF
jgi:hypothetical protein